MAPLYTPAELKAAHGFEDIDDVINPDNEDADLARRGWTQAHLAARRGCAQTIESLLRASPDMVAKADKFGRTPLHFAAFKCHTAAYKAMTNAGVPCTCDMFGRDDHDYIATFGMTGPDVQENLLRIKTTLKRMADDDERPHPTPDHHIAITATTPSTE
jgi:ankyrin repeat protein